MKWRERGRAEGVEWGNTYGPSAFLVEGIGANVPPDQMRGPSERVHIPSFCRGTLKGLRSPIRTPGDFRGAAPCMRISTWVVQFIVTYQERLAAEEIEEAPSLPFL